MLLKVIGTLAALAVLFLIYVSTRDGKFHYERSGVINASPEKIFPYLSDFHRGGEWSPYQKMDPEMKLTFTGPDASVGSKMEFEGSNGKAGSGNLEILKVVPNESVDIKLTMTKPWHAENLIEYKLAPESGGGTKFTWAMSGDGGFMGKLVGVIMDCEKMVAGEFSEGVGNLKTIVEKENLK